ncbi:hypothetical protein LXL04_038373 [Taraxacum kok-saghyz]
MFYLSLSSIRCVQGNIEARGFESAFVVRNGGNSVDVIALGGFGDKILFFYCWDKLLDTRIPPVSSSFVMIVEVVCCKLTPLQAALYTHFIHSKNIVEVVCCKLTPLQTALYTHFIHSKNLKKAIVEDVKQTKILAYITALKKLCNHPKLIYDTMKSGKPGTAGFENCMRFFPPEMFSGRSGSWTGGDGSWVELSGKMQVLARLLAHLRKKTDDRIVLVSNYTQTLDLIVQLCRERRYPFLRLDGSTSISKRQKLVNCFNDQSKVFN